MHKRFSASYIIDTNELVFTSVVQVNTACFLSRQKWKRVSAVSPRELRWLFAKREEYLTPDKHQDMKCLLETSQEAKQPYCLLQSFLAMLRRRRPEQLNAWMKQTHESGIKELGSFVAGIERDYDAVRAGLTFPWNHDYVA